MPRHGQGSRGSDEWNDCNHQRCAQGEFWRCRNQRQHQSHNQRHTCSRRDHRLIFSSPAQLDSPGPFNSGLRILSCSHMFSFNTFCMARNSSSFNLPTCVTRGHSTLNTPSIHSSAAWSKTRPDTGCDAYSNHDHVAESIRRYLT
jgi:hypothetical protein